MLDLLYHGEELSGATEALQEIGLPQEAFAPVLQRKLRQLEADDETIRQFDQRMLREITPELAPAHNP